MAALLEESSDSDQLERTFDEWERNAKKVLARLERLGVRVRSVEVDVDEIVSWCREQERPFDSDARAAFTARKLRDRSG